MALKTTIRRLLSKYGYLSVEMQNALSKDVEEQSMASRNEIIEEQANKQAITIDESSYEEVDTETGEIKNGAADASQEDMPNY